MIQTKMAFGSDAAVDMYDMFRFIYVDSDDLMHAPMRDNEESSYMDEQGSHSPDKYLPDTFDYKIRFVVEGSAGLRTNACVKKFIRHAHAGECTKEITYTNTYKRVKIVGRYRSLEEKSFCRNDGVDNLSVELTIRVTEPSKCDFDYDTD